MSFDVQLYSCRYLCSTPDFLSASKHVALSSFCFRFAEYMPDWQQTKGQAVLLAVLENFIYVFENVIIFEGSQFDRSEGCQS